MYEYLEISLYVLRDGIDDQIYDRIIGEIKRIDRDIIKVTYTHGTNAIDVLAHWNESEVDERIGEMQRIANVKNVIVVHKKYVRHIKEHIKISDNVSWNLEKDPIGEINRALEAKDYYKAISLACTVFQYLGKDILSRQATNAKTVSKKTDLHTIIHDLHSEGIIDKIFFEKMEEAKTLRNILQHEDRGMKFSSNQAAETEETIIKALDCVKFLKKRYDSKVDQRNE